MNEDKGKLDSLMEYVKKDGRICPLPIFWNEFWEMLPEKTQTDEGWVPPLPIILGGWYDTPPLWKLLRFHTQIEYAAEHSFLEQADQYLRSLSDDQWFFIS